MAPQFPVLVVVRAVDRATEPLRRINARVAAARKPWVDLGASVARFSDAAGLPRIRAAASEAMGAVRNLAAEVWSMTSRAALGLAGVAAGIYATVRAYASWADRLGDTSARLRVNVETLQAWQYAAKLADVDAGQLDSSLSKLVRNLELARRGGRAQADAFLRLGVEVADSNGRLRTLDELLPELADRLADVADPMRRVALAQALFGKGGDKLLPMLLNGADGLAAMAKEARRLGMVLSEGDIRAAAEIADEFDRFESAVLGVRNALAAALGPAVRQVLGQLTAWLVDNRERLAAWGRRIGEELPRRLAALAATVGRVWDALEPLRALLSRVVDVVGPLGVALGALAAVMVVSIVPAVASVVTALVGLSGALVATPAGWVVLAIAAVVVVLVALAAAVVYVASRWDELSARFPAAARLLRTVANVAVAVLRFQLAALGWVLEHVAELVLGALDVFARLVEFVTGSIVPAFKAWDGALGGVLSKVGKLLGYAVRFTPLGLAIRGLAGIGGASSPASAAGASSSAAPDPLAAAVRPVAAAQGRAHVVVDFKNLPRGARVTQDRARDVDFDLGLGYSMVGL